MEATLDVPSRTPIHETSLPVLKEIVAGVVQIEGPIHREEVARRVTSLWGLQRTGARIAEAISRAVDEGIRLGVLLSNEEFVAHCNQTTVSVRSRAGVTSASLKKPEMIPHAEIRQAILYLAAEHVGVGRDELMLMVAKALGFKAAGAKLKDTIEGVLKHIVEHGVLDLRDEKLFVR